MLWSRLYLAAVLTIVHVTSASPTPHEDGKISNVPLPVEKVATSHLVVAENVLPLLRRRNGLAAKGSAVLQNASDASQNITPILPVHNGLIYAINISFGGESFEVMLDTGSSDLWLPSRGVKCLGDDGARTACNFGPLADPGFQDGGIANETFEIHFADHTSTSGVLGYKDVGIGATTVRHQKVGIVDRAHFDGEKVTSGLIGFGYPSHTSAYTLDGVRAPYNNWLFNAIDQKLIDPVFSLSVQRGVDGGQLALGGLPPSASGHIFASTPILKANSILVDLPDLSLANRGPGNYSSYSRYAIVPNGYSLDGKHHASTSQMLVDSGATLMHMPLEMALAVNNAFQPPAKDDADYNTFLVRCNAKPPSFAINIGGTSFHIKAEDMILSRSAARHGEDLPKGHCISSVQASNSSMYALGDTFLKNVIAVFDIGQGQMHFAPHDY
ncbi:hypothetical protein LTS10_000537 [Elasticomyces elasticus]|nr:hypothetical protein LTS10_000537 [Elasticomyces elasticus]